MRDYGALIRLTCAIARAHCRNNILEKDADQAIELMKASIASSGYNPMLGQEALPPEEREEEETGMLKERRNYLQEADAPYIIKYKEKALKKQRTQFLRICEYQGLSRCEACGGLGRERGSQTICLGCNGRQVVTLPLAAYAVIQEAEVRGRLDKIHAKGMWDEMVRRGFIVPNTSYSGVSGYWTLTKDGIELVLNRSDKETIEKYSFYQIYGSDSDHAGLSMKSAATLIDIATDVSKKILGS
jgi:hypothetical protein